MSALLKTRSYDAELMDDLAGDGPDMARTLDELEVINRRLGGHKVVLDGLSFLLRNLPADKVIRIADLGCGGGDMLRIVARWARAHKRKVELVGIDANSYITSYAFKQSRDYPEIEYRQADVFSDSFVAEHFDIMMCSLFCHHFHERDLSQLFANMRKQAQVGVIVNDLHRHWLAYHSIKYLTLALSRSPLVRNDAPLSVARAFKRNELESILHNAGIHTYSIRWMWAFRWQLVF